MSARTSSTKGNLAALMLEFKTASLQLQPVEGDGEGWGNGEGDDVNSPLAVRSGRDQGAVSTRASGNLSHAQLASLVTDSPAASPATQTVAGTAH